MNMRQKYIIVAMIGIAILLIWISFQDSPAPIPMPTPNMTTTPAPEMLLAQPMPTPVPTPTLNMTATPTPTRRVTTGWQHGGGRRSSRRNMPIVPIPELATIGFVGTGLTLLYLKARR